MLSLSTVWLWSPETTSECHEWVSILGSLSSKTRFRPHMFDFRAILILLSSFGLLLVCFITELVSLFFPLWFLCSPIIMLANSPQYLSKSFLSRLFMLIGVSGCLWVLWLPDGPSLTVSLLLNPKFWSGFISFLVSILSISMASTSIWTLCHLGLVSSRTVLQ